ncbi:hypothetical protein BgiBS90_015527, partial [Biomphalaria glabrata]
NSLEMKSIETNSLETNSLETNSEQIFCQLHNFQKWKTVKDRLRRKHSLAQRERLAIAGVPYRQSNKLEKQVFQDPNKN